MTPPDPEVPQHDAADAETLLEVTQRAHDAGYTEQFVAREDGDVDCSKCGNAVNPAAVTVDHIHRLEGASDAADLLLAAEASCPTCGAKGLLVLGYGPNSSLADQRVLTHLPIDRADSGPVAE